MNIYNFCQGWDRKPGGEDETVEKNIHKGKLTIAHLSVIALDVRM